MTDRKQYEISYVDKLSEEETKWLYTKPFGNFNRDESRRTFHDFSTILYLLDQKAPKGKMGLDLGCGPGWLSIFLGKMGYRMTGVDIAPKMIEVANSRAKNEAVDIEFVTGDFEEQKDPKSYDFVVIYDALHHAPENSKVIKYAYESLKPGGIFLLSEPNIVHSRDDDSLEAQERFGVTERGLSVPDLKQELRKIGFKEISRYHGSGQSTLPRSESFGETLKMIVYPWLARFYFGNKRTRIWITAKK